jgi:hypothetical protein
VVVNKIAKQLNISIGSAYFVVHGNHQFHKVCTMWMPKEVTDEHKCVHLDICYCHLARYCEEGDNFMQLIITGNETWVHHYQPENRQKSTQWKHLSSPVAKKKFKTQSLAGKLMLIIFWDSQGPIPETYPERRTAVTSAVDCDMLQRGLKPAVCLKRRRLSEGILLLHNNAHLHTVAHMLETLRKLVGGHGTSRSQSRFDAI